MSRRVLIVEDDALSLKLMRDVLQARGYETCEAGEGSAAVTSAIEEAPDLIVMDVGLPGMDGVEATRGLQTDPRTSAIPIIAVTAFAMPEDRRRMEEAGCAVYLSKPLNLGEFVGVVEDVLAGRVRHA